VYTLVDIDPDVPEALALVFTVRSRDVDSVPDPVALAVLGDVCSPRASPPVEPFPEAVAPLGDVCSPFADSELEPEAKAVPSNVRSCCELLFPFALANADLGEVCKP
jgi:hypothetical protein